MQISLTVVTQDVELARWQHPKTKEWWRLTRLANSKLSVKSPCALESISERSLERGLCWAFACAVTVERHEYVIVDRVRAEAEAYLALRNR